VGLTYPLDELDRRIDARVDAQMRSGLVDEVRRLVESGFQASLTSVQALGYAQLLPYVEGAVPLEDAVAEIKRRTRRYARRQLSWFRADPRVDWYEADPRGAARRLTGGRPAPNDYDGAS
jgi:tRNA dimethylallyltransferase